MKKSVLTLLIGLGTMTTGCAQQQPNTILSNEKMESHAAEHKHHAEHTVADIREKTQNSNDLPSFLNKQPEDMKRLYSEVAKHRALLENIPCFCGCGTTAGHKNNYDCFIYENKDDGAVVWDDHATRCGVCLKIADEAIKQYDSGASIKEIRAMIDKKYEKGYATPTPTLPVK